MTFEKTHRLLKGKKVLNGFESGIFSIKKQTQGKWHPLDLGCLAKVCDLKVSDENINYSAQNINF